MEMDGVGEEGTGSGAEQRPDRGGIQVIARAAAILRVLRDDSEGLSLGQIAERVDLPRSTVQRIAGALMTERFVVSDRRRGGLRLGPEIGAMAEAARHTMIERCRRLLTEIAQETGETADLAILRDGEMVFIHQVPGQHRLRAVSSVGETFPVTTTANGRACLALLPEDEAMQIARQEWARHGHQGDAEGLRTALVRTRATGLAYDIDEHTDGISAIGFAFRDMGRDLYAISVPVPSTRFAEARATIEQALLRAGATLVDDFGTTITGGTASAP